MSITPSQDALHVPWLNLDNTSSDFQDKVRTYWVKSETQNDSKRDVQNILNHLKGVQTSLASSIGLCQHLLSWQNQSLVVPEQFRLMVLPVEHVVQEKIEEPKVRLDVQKKRTAIVQDALERAAAVLKASVATKSSRDLDRAWISDLRSHSAVNHEQKQNTHYSEAKEAKSDSLTSKNPSIPFRTKLHISGLVLHQNALYIATGQKKGLGVGMSLFGQIDVVPNMVLEVEVHIAGQSACWRSGEGQHEHGSLSLVSESQVSGQQNETINGVEPSTSDIATPESNKACQMQRNAFLESVVDGLWQDSKEKQNLQARYNNLTFPGKQISMDFENGVKVRVAYKLVDDGSDQTLKRRRISEVAGLLDQDQRQENNKGSNVKYENMQYSGSETLETSSDFTPVKETECPQLKSALRLMIPVLYADHFKALEIIQEWTDWLLYLHRLQSLVSSIHSVMKTTGFPSKFCLTPFTSESMLTRQNGTKGPLQGHLSLSLADQFLQIDLDNASRGTARLTLGQTLHVCDHLFYLQAAMCSGLTHLLTKAIHTALQDELIRRDFSISECKQLPDQAAPSQVVARCAHKVRHVKIAIQPEFSGSELTVQAHISIDKTMKTLVWSTPMTITDWLRNVCLQCSTNA